MATIADADGAASAIAQYAGNSPDDMPKVEGLTFPGPVAERFFNDDGLVVGIQGPVGSAKTTTMFLSRVRRARMMPMSVIDGVRYYKMVITRQTYRELWSTTIPSYLETFPKNWGTWSGGRGDPVTHVIPFEDEFGPIEMIAEFKAYGDDITAAMRGVQTTDWLMNEADTQHPDVISNAITRINRWPQRRHFEGYPPEHRSYAQIVCDMNAPEEDNWAFDFFHNEEKRREVTRELNTAMQKEFPDAPPLEINFHVQPGGMDKDAENKHNLAPGYYNSQLATLKLSGRGDLIERLIHNRSTFTRIGTPVFDREFNRAVHVARDTIEMDRSQPLLIGLDQGFLGAAVIAQFFEPFHWRILGEMMFPKERLFAKEFGRRLRELLDGRFEGHRVGGAWGDMAGEHGSALTDHEKITWNMLVSQHAGITIKPQIIGTNRIDPRLEAVRAPLEYLDGGEPGLLIDPSCKHLIAGFEARYVWTDEINPSGDKRKVPDKRVVEANVMDALEYLCLSRSDGNGLVKRHKAMMDIGQSSRIGHNGGPPMKGGLQTGFDVTNPYGG